MRTVKWNPFLSGVCTILGGVLLWAGAARADVTSTNPSAILVFPKIVVSTTAFRRVDTLFQLTNTSATPVSVRCFYVNANGHCSDNPTQVCDPNRPKTPGADPGIGVNPCSAFSSCVPGWVETDFRFKLTPKQPIAWTLSDGLLDFPLPDIPGGNEQSSIPQASEDPMIGELKCVEVGDDEQPIDANDLKGEATIETVAITPSTAAAIDTAGYNAIGIQAIEGQNNRDDTLVLGEEYNGCPSLLVLDHFFDGAKEPNTRDTIDTEVTFVPCSEDFRLQIPKKVTVQFLVFNEFEQRFSTSRPIQCVTNLPLSDIDTRLGPTDDTTSIFNIGVQGTLTGQTIARGVDDPSSPEGEGILAVLQEFHSSAVADHSAGSAPDLWGPEVFSAAFAPYQRGVRPQTDTIQLPGAAPPAP